MECEKFEQIIDTNESFWRLSSWGINIPFETSKGKYAIIIYPSGKFFTKWVDSWWNWRNGKNFSLESMDDFSTFARQINAKVTELNNWEEQTLSEENLKLIFNYHFITQDCINDREVVRGEILSFSTDSKAVLQYSWWDLVFEKLIRGVKIIWGEKEDEIFFDSQSALNTRLGKWLDQEFWSTREKIGREFSIIYKTLKLDESTWMRVLDESQNSVNWTFDWILDLSVWEYRLNNQAITYLLVRNDNTGSYYCLSWVQEFIDITFGKWTAKSIWLYKSRLAEDLDFSWNPNVTVYKGNNIPSWVLPTGTIIRMKRFYSWTLTHIWVIWKDWKLLHIVWDTFYVDESLNATSWGSVYEVVVPNNLWEVINDVQETKTIFQKWLSLETIWYRLKQMSALGLTGVNQAYIDEAIYQINREKFELQRESWDTRMNLKDDSKLLIPSHWYKNQ